VLRKLVLVMGEKDDKEDDRRTCALPGCNEKLPKGSHPKKRYCTDAHKQLAYRQRKAAA